MINYDYPNCSEDYVHRIGRTGRRDKKGTAYTFFTSANQKQARELIGVLKEANQVINPKLYDMADSNRGGGGGRNRRWGGYSGGGGGGRGLKRKTDGGRGSSPNKRPMYSNGNNDYYSHSQPDFSSLLSSVTHSMKPSTNGYMNGNGPAPPVPSYPY